MNLELNLEQKLDISKVYILTEIRNMLYNESLPVDEAYIIGSFCYSLIYNDIDLVTCNEQIYSFLLYNKNNCIFNINPILVEKEEFDSYYDKLTFCNTCIRLNLDGTRKKSNFYKNNLFKLYYNDKNIFTSIEQNKKVFLNIHNEHTRIKESLEVLNYFYDNFNKDFEENYPEVFSVISQTDQSTMIAGGFIRDYILNKDMNHNKDVDIFVMSENSFKIVRERFLKVGLKEVPNNSAVVKLKNAKFLTKDGKNIDLVFIPEATSYTTILNTFDYTINMIGYDMAFKFLVTSRYTTNEYQIEHILSKRLVVTPNLLFKAHKPNRALMRLKKFLEQGYTIDEFNLKLFNKKVMELIK